MVLISPGQRFSASAPPFSSKLSSCSVRKQPNPRRSHPPRSPTATHRPQILTSTHFGPLFTASTLFVFDAPRNQKFPYIPPQPTCVSAVTSARTGSLRSAEKTSALIIIMTIFETKLESPTTESAERQKLNTTSNYEETLFTFLRFLFYCHLKSLNIEPKAKEFTLKSLNTQ